MKRLAAALACAAIGLAIHTGVAHAAGPDPWVNELHYDNAGTDANEGVEVAGPAGTSLTGWSLVFSNGVDGLPYASFALSGAVPDQQAGSGTAWFAVPDIQNGARDALALVAPGGRVVQLLGYEGASTILAGPAAGLTASTIGPFEAPSTALGSSLGLRGTGNAGPDFRWARPAPASPGRVNPGQRFAVALPPTSSPPAVSTTRALPALAFADGPTGALSRNTGRGDATVVRFVLRAPTTVQIRVRRARGGRRLGAGCLRPSVILRDLPACLRYGTTLATADVPAAIGERRLRLTDAPFDRLAPGAYRVTISVAGQRSRRVYLRLRA